MENFALVSFLYSASSFHFDLAEQAPVLNTPFVANFQTPVMGRAAGLITILHSITAILTSFLGLEKREKR